MKHLTNNNLLAIGPLVIIILAVIFGLFGLSLVFAASRAGEVNLISPRVDVEATARAIRFENRQARLEAASRQRIEAIQAKISQTGRSLRQLDQALDTQTAQYRTQLAAVEQQIEQKQAAVETMRASVIRLKQELIQAEADYQARLATIQGEERQTEAELEAVSRQLATAQAELEAIKPSTPESAAGDDPSQSDSASSRDDSDDEREEHDEDDDTEDDHDAEDHSDDDKDKGDDKEDETDD